MSREKSEKLGMSFGKAKNILNKSILFDLIKQLNKDVCYHCGKKIENIKQLSIEHKKSWFLSNTPKKDFFDLNNISFSHLSCNCGNTTVTEKVRDSRRKFKKMAETQLGQDKSCSKLKNHDVLKIKEMLKENVPLREIARKFSVTHQQIMRIRDEKHWKHL